MRLSRMYLWLLAAGVVATLVLIFNAALGFYFVRDLGIWIGLGGVAVGYSLLGLACAAAYENARAPRVMRLGMLTGALSLLAWCTFIFAPEFHASSLAMVACTWLTMPPAAIALIGMLLLLPMPGRGRRRLRAVAIVMIVGLALYIAAAVTLHPRAGNEWSHVRWEVVAEYEQNAYQIGTAITAMTAATVAIALLAGVVGSFGSSSRGRQSQDGVSYWLQCPRCAAEQNAQAGEHLCVRCGLRTKLEVL